MRRRRSARRACPSGWDLPRAGACRRGRGWRERQASSNQRAYPQSSASPSAQLLPQAQPPQLLLRLEAEHHAVDLAAAMQHETAQQLDALGLGLWVRLEGNVLRKPLDCLLVEPLLVRISRVRSLQ